MSMEYQELMERALRGRSVRKAAQMWGVHSATMDKYARGERVPNYKVTQCIIEDSGTPAEEVLRVIAALEELRENTSVAQYRVTIRKMTEADVVIEADSAVHARSMANEQADELFALSGAVGRDVFSVVKVTKASE